MAAPAVNDYVKWMEASQNPTGNAQFGRGAEFPVFTGSPFYYSNPQTGAGIGEILKGAWNWGFPLLARGASTFLGELLKGRESGGGWKEAAKSALVPTATGLLRNTAETIAEATEKARRGDEKKQTGSGKRRKHKSKQYKRKKEQRVDYSDWNF